MKLQNHPYTHCSVRKSNGWTILTSYETDVIIIDNAGWLYVNGLYSATTRKHIGYFLKEYAPGMTYQAAKSLYENDEVCNIHNGEICPAIEILNRWEQM